MKTQRCLLCAEVRPCKDGICVDCREGVGSGGSRVVPGAARFQYLGIDDAVPV